MLSNLWDFCFCVLIAFPLLTGGIWVRRPGLFIEHSNIGIPVLVMALFALAISRKGSANLKNSYFYQTLGKSWTAWTDALQKKPALTLVAGTFVWSLLEGLASLRRHWAFHSNAYDLGIFTNALWNWTHGFGYISSVKGGMNLFADHQSPILFLFAPIYALFPHAETLLALQALGLASGAIALYWLGTQYLKRDSWQLGALPLLYWAFLPLRKANLFDFHPEVLMLPFFLFAIAGLQSKPWRLRIFGSLSLLLALASKESAGPVAAALGLAWLLGASPEAARSFTRKAGLLVLIAGIGTFLFDLKIVPTLLGAQYSYSGLYKQFGPHLTDLALAPVLQPKLFFSHIFAADRIRFVMGSLLPFLFLPILSPRSLLVALPGYLMLFLSEGNHRINLDYHYIIEPAVGLFFALPAGLAAADKLSNTHRQLAKWLPLTLLVVAAGSFGRSPLFWIRDYAQTEHTKWLHTEFLPSLDPETTLAATNALVPHFADRHWAHLLPEIRVTGELTVNCIIDDSSLNNWNFGTAERNALFSSLPDYVQIYSCESVRVFQQLKADRSCFVRVPHCSK